MKVNTKSIQLLVGLIAFIHLISCSKKEEENLSPEPPTVNVRVAIDYLGSGGYYTDDIGSIPDGLITGSANGPFKVTQDKTYTIAYKANNNFNVLTYQTNFGGGISVGPKNWVIHCYIEDNTEYIKVVPE